MNYLRTTATDSGLRVRARLVRKHYAKGERISDPEMDQLPLTRHEIMPDWNYTLVPR